MAELERHYAGKRLVILRESAIGEHFERRTFRILKRYGLANAGGDVAPPFAFDAGFL
jgi:hypothetical protein